MMNEETLSTEFSPKVETIDKDQRRSLLLNDSNYGIILCFLERFRTQLDLPNYSLQRFEDHLINYQERDAVPPRLIDFHFILLKRLSLAKNTQREKFESIVTKFAARFDLNDSDHLTTAGYLQAEVNVKARILKNLLESQFDLNQTFKNALADKPAREVKSVPLGRDRFGVSYWLFMDAECFVRLFREDVDIDRTWKNIAKDRTELENFIKLLITDAVVRNKFTDWTIDYEPFSSLLASNEFEQHYVPVVIEKHEYEEEKLAEPVKKKRGRPKRSSELIKDEDNEMKQDIDEDEEEEADATLTDDEEKTDTPMQRKRGRPRGSVTVIKKEVKEEELDVTLNEDETQNEPAKKRRGRPKGSIKLTSNEKPSVPIEIKEEKQEIETMDVSPKRRPGRPKSITKQTRIEIKEDKIKLVTDENEQIDEPIKKRRGRPRASVKSLNDDNEGQDSISSVRRGRKRKIVTDGNSSDDDYKIEENNDKQSEESSTHNGNNALRRSSRPRKPPPTESASTVNSRAASQVHSGRKKRSVNGKAKLANDSTTNHKPTRSRRRRKGTSRRSANHEFRFSSSSSDEHVDYISDDEYDSDEYLTNPAQLEQDENFFALDEDNTTTGEELRTAKTAQASTVITACKVCSKSDRPEVLLLCDDCDDAYHIECLRPALLSVPDGDWFCPLCEHKKLSNQLIEKLKELLINFNNMEIKRAEHEAKKTLERKLKVKEYTSDESVTASESEHENLENNLHADESTLSTSQNNENSNISSSLVDDPNKNISQRGRHRRTRFDMNKMLNNDDDSDDDDNYNSSTDDEDDDDDDDDDYDADDYVETPPQITNFDLQIPKKMTRLLTPRYRPIMRNDQRLKPKPIAPRLPQTSTDLNGKISYNNNMGIHAHEIKPIITNSNQTLKIVRRWNDVQRRHKLRINTSTKSTNDTTSDCADENSVFCPDDTSPPRSNESHANSDMREEDCTIIRSKITLVQPANLLPMYKSSTRNIVTKNEVNFDRLTRDIQYAVSEANTLSTMPKTIDQQNVKRIQKTNFSPYLTKVSIRPLPLLLPKPAGVGYKIFKSKDPPASTTDLSNIILTPSSSSSLLDPNDDHSTSALNT